MGQQIHPIGLRVGVSRKWASSWYINPKETTSPQQSFGVISARGGMFLSGMEETLTHLFKRYSLTKFTNTSRVIIVDFRLFKGFGGHRYGFRVYTKLLTQK